MTADNDVESAMLLLDLWGTYRAGESREGMNILNNASFYLTHRSTYPEPRNPSEGCR